MPRPDPLSPGDITGQNPAIPERLHGHTADVPSTQGADNEEKLGGRPAFLFRAGDMRAVTLDQSGANLPDGQVEPWQLAAYITLGVRNANIEGINPEPIIRGVYRQGYYCWRASNPARMDGTSQ